MKFSFLGLGQENAPLQIYGKLPVAKDYLRIGCGEGAGRELREWLDRTFGTVRDSSEQLHLVEPLRFLGMGDKDPLQGYLWPSSDEGERRKFPFTVFVERRRKSMMADLNEGNLAGAEGVWRVLYETRERCLASADGQTLLDEHRGRDVDIDATEAVPGAAADFDAWVAALWGSEGLEGLKDLLGRASSLASENHAGPFRLPLVRHLPLRDQVIAWVFALRALGALPENEVPSLFFPLRAIVPSSEPCHLVASRRPLGDEEVTWITAAAGETLGAADFAVGDTSDGFDEAPPEGRTWLREPLLATLQSLVGRSS